MTDTDRRERARERQRAAQRDYRLRKRRGYRCVRLIIDVGTVGDVLVETGKLGQWDADNPAAVGEALQDLINSLQPAVVEYLFGDDDL